MSTMVILHPDDATKAYIGSYSESVFGINVGAGVMCNIHAASKCAGRPCVIHAPSDHHMSKWNLHWRDDTGVFERTCPHGVGHPDPDQFEFWAQCGNTLKSTHGCDGCCK